MNVYDVAVVGAGFGGLGAALGCAERGASTVLFETLRYPGGCASTFQRRGHRFESGATMVSGFGVGQQFARWRDRHDLGVQIEPLDPVVEFRNADFTLAVPSDRAAYVDRICALRGVPGPETRAFFDRQLDVADLLWAFLDDSRLLPPLDARAVARHALRLPRYAGLLGLLGRPLVEILARYGIEDCRPLRHLLDSICQITVQAPSATAEATFALPALDYFFRGTGHVVGGLGQLAWGLTGAFERLGGTAHFADRALSAAPAGGTWRLTTRRREVLARCLVLNLLPQDAATLLGRQHVARELACDITTGWGASMLYGAFKPDADLPDHAFHLDLTTDCGQPLHSGNHVFCSVSAPGKKRTLTCSTHIPMQQWLRLDDDGRAAFAADVQRAISHTLAARAPEVVAALDWTMPASPRTFARFTGREHGCVGGVPRLAGLSGLKQVGPMAIDSRCYLVGDSVFPGQSALATAVGGERTAEALSRELR